MPFDCFPVSQPSTCALNDYDVVVVLFSGGKDCLAALLDLLERGVPRHRIELHHHLVDGEGPVFMDWPVTRAYVAAIGLHFGLPVFHSWREGGFQRELWKDGQASAPVIFETLAGQRMTVGGRGRPNRRGRFPQVVADLRTRWCSPILKIDVMDMVLRNDPRLQGKRILVVDGCRAEESAGRARYQVFEPHRADARRSGRRHVDVYRPVHGWTEAEIWNIIARHGIIPHPAYQLGWNRVSCRGCVFLDSDALASLRRVFPEAFATLSVAEAKTGFTIGREGDVVARADQGHAFVDPGRQQQLIAIADGTTAPEVRCDPSDWRLPAGAFRRASNGPR